jgi:putative membrane protein
MKTFARWLMMTGMAAAAPAWAVSLATTGPAHPLPDTDAVMAALPLAENLTAGSASLVPLMAVDMPAERTSTIDASAATGGGNVGKPIDDISFIARATDSGRKEAASARDALPQLKDPDLKRLAEMLVNDHGNANARLMKIAEAKMWQVPPAQRQVAPPAGTAMPDFDEKWTAEMIAAHERSAALYSAQAAGGEDLDLRQYARETLPTIQHHLAELRRLQK